MELGLRQALFQDGRHLLEALLKDAGRDLPGTQSQPGEKCHPQRLKEVQTLFGAIQIRRDYFYDPEQGRGRVPLDEALGLIDGSSPGLVRLASRAAARCGYEGASQDLAALAGLQIEGRQIQRLVQHSGPCVGAELQAPAPTTSEPVPLLYVEVDGTGVPMVPEELAGRPGKQADGSAKTREAKLGCVFTQTKTDEEGCALRDHQSTTYVGSFDSAEPFGLKVRAEARRRGMALALVVVFLGDGAAWVWELARLNFPGAICILDFYHALEHLHQLCQSLYEKQPTWAQRMREQWTHQLAEDGVEQVMAAARRRTLDLDPSLQEDLEKQIAYFENNKERMRYKTFRQQGYFCGSGVVEAGCKTVIGQRLKQSGMLWTEQGAQCVINLRCALMGNRWDECWNRINHSHYLRLDAAA